MNINAKAGSLTYRVQKIDPRFSYCGDFELIIANPASNPVALKCFDGPPFKIIYTVDGHDYPLIHKLDQHADDNGASRVPQERNIEGNGTTGFFVDLNGDFIVRTASGEAKLFREFAAGKKGKIKLEPTQTDLFQSKGKTQIITVVGTHPVIEPE